MVKKRFKVELKKTITFTMPLIRMANDVFYQVLITKQNTKRILIPNDSLHYLIPICKLKTRYCFVMATKLQLFTC